MGIILRYKDILTLYKTRGHRLRELEKYNFWFPLNSSESLSGIIADLICDGHLQGDPKWRIDYTSNSKKELRRFEKEVFNLFRIKGKIRKCTTNKFGLTYNYGINCSPLARTLYLCGVPSGNKVKQKFAIPNWILTNKLFFKRFVKRMFTCEGSILFEKPRKIQIRLELWKLEKYVNSNRKLLNEIKHYLKKYFDIDSTIKVQKRFLNQQDNEYRRAVRAYLFRDAVKKFSEYIGFEGEKQDKLIALLG